MRHTWTAARRLPQCTGIGQPVAPMCIAHASHMHRYIHQTYSTHTTHIHRMRMSARVSMHMAMHISTPQTFFWRHMSMHTYVHMPTPTCLRTGLCTCLSTCLYAHHRCCIDVLLQRSHRVGLVIADMLARMSGHKCAHYVGL